MYKEKLIPVLKLFQKAEEGRTLPNSFHGENTPKLIPQGHQKQRHYQKKEKENYRLIFLMNINAKILNRIISKPNSTTYKKDHIQQSSGIYSRNAKMTQYPPINVIHHIKKE